MDKTESQILSMRLSLTFGEKDYKVNVLRILQSEDWRSQLLKTLIPLCDSFRASPAIGDGFAGALTQALLGFPEKIRELVFAYAPDLPKQEIMETASDRQFSAAFSAIMEEAYPFLASLRMVMQVMESRQQSANSTK